jgi:hypothetical protein
MIPHPAAILAIVLSAQVAAAQQPEPADPEKQKLEMKQRAEEQAKALPTTRAASPETLVRFSVEDNHLHLRTTMPPTDGERVRVNVPGFSGLVFLQIRGEQAEPGKPYLPEMLMLIHEDYTRADAVVSITHVAINPSQVMVTRDTDFGNDALLSVQLIQSGQYLAEGEDMIHFRVNGSTGKAGKELDLHLTAPSVVELVRRYPTETAEYLQPIFSDFGQADVLFRVDPQTAWQVLGALQEPSPELAAKVSALLKQLDAENPDQRAAAAAELKKLGQPAALVLMRQDRERLSEEQKMQLDAFLAEYRPLPEEEAAKMRKDPRFLLLALGADDTELRKLAMKQLEKVSGEQIEFDVQADPEARSQAIATLRARLLTSTTQPDRAASTKQEQSPAAPDRSQAAP